VIREAATVILLRRAPRSPASAGSLHAGPGFEVFLVRRNRGASFMASAYVFPGGATEEGEDARTAAARELFEEAGVLLAVAARDAESETLEMASQDRLRQRVLGGADATAVLKLAGLTWATDALAPWSHWITPSIEKKRFSARFFVAELPSGQEPSFDQTETVDQVWVRPAEGIERGAELKLPPPQIRTLWELSQFTLLTDVIAASAQRAAEPHPIMPRLAPGDHPRLLLPWDPEYMTAGTGEATPLTYKPSWATGPSRFEFDGDRWKHV
jgi:8-oxo-dGTP pyrophosphatase MutT (NUDIX family)